MIKLPNDSKRLIQSNRSNLLGDIYSSFNLDLSSNLGKIKVSPRSLLTTSSGTVENLGVASSFNILGTSGDANYGIWTPAGARMFKNSGLIYGNFTQDATTGTPTDLNSGSTNPDSEIYDGSLFVTGNNKLYKLATTGNWSTITGGLGARGAIIKYGNKLYFVHNGSEIAYSTGSTPTTPTSYSVGGSNAVGSTLNLAFFGGSTSNTITSLRASSNRIWIATMNERGGKGRIYEWDGASTDPIRFYVLESAGALAMTIKDDVPWIVDTDGRLLAYNGGAFVEKARLPVKNYRYLRNPFATLATDRFIHFNGMSVVEDRIQLLINGQYQKENLPLEPELPSGIWEYTDSNGLYHKESLSTWIYQSTTTAADYGISRLKSVGALATFKSTSDASNYNGSLICGAEYYTDATTAAKGIFIDDTNDTIVKTGFLVTPEYHSATTLDNFQSAILKHRQFLDADDSIVIKYRTEKVAALEITGTWTSTTTFTTSTNLGAYLGYEVFITNGKGAGIAAHISSVTGSGTYTVTLDEAIGDSSGTFKALVENWTKCAASASGEQFKEFSFLAASEFIQLKTFFKVTGEFEMNELQVNNVKQK
jgi:hypothetical protein